MLNIGFIGTGDMGRHQAKSFAAVKGCRVAAGSDVAEASRAAFAKQFPQAKVYPDHAALLKDASIDAVVVAAPTLYHKQIVIDALQSGRPVLSEKPMARTVADCRRMNDVAEKTGKLLMVAHCRRYDADWGTFGKIVRDGKLGTPLLWRHVSAGYGPGPSWFNDDKLGGGPLIDGAVHNYDFANLIFGDPESVIASSIKLTPNTAIDTATAVVRYKGGHQLMLNWSWGVAPTGARVLDALGPKASVLFGAGPLSSPELDTKKYGYYCMTELKSRKSKLVRFARKDMYVAQARHFLECIAGKATCQSPGTEAIKAVAVAEAVLKSAPNATPVKVTW